MSMNSRVRRRMALADLMIVVLTAALSLTAWRTTLRDLPLGWFYASRPAPGGFRGRYLDFAFCQAVPLLMAASFAAFALRLRPPRRPLRQLAHCPGFVLALAAASAALATLLFWPDPASSGDRYRLDLQDFLLFTAPQMEGYAVL